MGWLADCTGDVAEAELQFTTADQLQVFHRSGRRSPVLRPRHAVGRVAGPDRADRPGPDADRPQRQISAGRTAGTKTWPGVTGCWAAWPWPPGTPARPQEHLTAATTVFRDGDFLIELAVTLADLALCALASEEPGGRRAARGRGHHDRRPPRPGRRTLRRLGGPRPRIHAAKAAEQCQSGHAVPGTRRRLTPHSGWRAVITWRGRNSTRCALMRCSTGPRGSTGDGRRRRTPSRHDWFRRAWTRIRWPPWSGSLPRRKAGGPAVAVGAE